MSGVFGLGSIPARATATNRSAERMFVTVNLIQQMMCVYLMTGLVPVAIGMPPVSQRSTSSPLENRIMMIFTDGIHLYLLSSCKNKNPSERTDRPSTSDRTSPRFERPRAKSRQNDLPKLSDENPLNKPDYKAVLPFLRERGKISNPDLNDPFSILGLRSHASKVEVRKAYLKLCLTFHPDKATEMSEEDKKRMLAAFQLIDAAYKMILSPKLV